MVTINGMNILIILNVPSLVCAYIYVHSTSFAFPQFTSYILFITLNLKMIFHYIFNLFLVIELMKHGAKLTSVHALSMQYYAIQCPLAEMFVKNTVNQALQNDPTLAAGLLRMHFHDCFVEVFVSVFILIISIVLVYALDRLLFYIVL